MTDTHSRESQMVTLRRDENGKATVWCDPEIADLVDALNNGTLSTIASCSGHGHRPGIVTLADGRILMVFDDLDHSEPANAAYPFDVNGDISTRSQRHRILPITTHTYSLDVNDGEGHGG